MDKLRSEIKQKKPFSSVQEEVVLALMRTGDLLTAPMTEVLKPVNLSLSQYNVLRILRGAGTEQLPCGEVTSRMVRREPDLTRLLDKLEARELVERVRSTTDRRSVLSRITPAGLALLESLEAQVEDTMRRTLAHVPVKRLRVLLAILEEIRDTPVG